MYKDPSRANLRYAGRIQIVIEFLLCTWYLVLCTVPIDISTWPSNPYPKISFTAAKASTKAKR
jgi:hypothetical protein